MISSRLNTTRTWIILTLSCCSPGMTQALDPAIGDFSRANPLNIRLVTYNTFMQFIADSGTDAAYARILPVLDPDVLVLQEIVNSILAGTIEDRLNALLPFEGSWQVHSGESDGFMRTVVASKYPMSMPATNTSPPASTRGVTLALIDLPDGLYSRDLYILGVHFKCCGTQGDQEKRQISADAVAHWLGDARQPGGSITLADDTPMVVLGDFNLVGGPQPEITLISGNIVNKGTFGADIKGDWDVSNMTDLTPRDPFTGNPSTYPSVASPSSRLDRAFYTDSVLCVSDSLVFNTRTLPGLALNNAGLLSSDTSSSSSSDHLPILMDITIGSGLGDDDVDSDGIANLCDNCADEPNPGQADGDLDGAGDACDNCPGAFNPSQQDLDSDSTGDACDADRDGDAFDNEVDNCPDAANANQQDADTDGVGDVCDACPGTLPNADVDELGCPAVVPGDFDGDGDVDLVDYAKLQNCYDMSGPPCEAYSMNGDDDIEAIDGTMFLGCLSGSRIAGDPSCLEP